MKDKKIILLVNSLFNGILIQKDWSKIEPTTYTSDETTVYILYAHYDDKHKHINFYGWGNRNMTIKSLLTEITTSPEWWNISPKTFEEKPWIPKQSELFK